MEIDVTILVVLAIIETIMGTMLIFTALDYSFNENANTKEINKLAAKVERLEKDKEEKAKRFDADKKTYEQGFIEGYNKGYNKGYSIAKRRGER